MPSKLGFFLLIKAVIPSLPPGKESVDFQVARSNILAAFPPSSKLNLVDSLAKLKVYKLLEDTSSASSN